MNTDVTEFLKTTELFKNIPPRILAQIASCFETVYLAGDEILLKEGDIGDSLFVVMYGYLHAVKKESDDKQLLIGELKAGQVVGEIACLIDTKRTATIYAVRDSVLLKMTRESFDLLTKKYPEAMMGITRQCISRLVTPRKNTNHATASCFTLIPAGSFADIETLAERFVAELSKYGDTLLLNEAQFNQIHGENSAQTPIESDKNMQLISWIQEMETKYRYIVYVAQDITPWALRCVRQADKILLVGDLKSSPRLNSLEKILFQKRHIIQSNVELVLLGDSSQRFATNTQGWLQDRIIASHYKIRLDKEGDIKRFIRLITGNALGLVLAGGGANALGHLGIIRALETLKIPVDYIAGTSMGALIGASMAIELSYDDMLIQLDKLFQKFTKSLDYTLPISALLRTRKLKNIMYEYYGEDTRIEELWTNFFCMSTDISSNEAFIHDSGPLWNAVRCSFSLPAIMPPLQDENNHIHVDGGILNNMPVDIMKQRMPNSKILAGSLLIKEEIPPKPFEDFTTSGWRLFARHILYPKLRRNNNTPGQPFMDIASIIHSSIVIASNQHQKAMIELADYNVILDINGFGLMDFAPIRQIADIGYETAMKVLPTIDLKQN